jgi:hypothetical protein
MKYQRLHRSKRSRCYASSSRVSISEAPALEQRSRRLEELKKRRNFGNGTENLRNDDLMT